MFFGWRENLISTKLKHIYRIWPISVFWSSIFIIQAWMYRRIQNYLITFFPANTQTLSMIWSPSKKPNQNKPTLDWKCDSLPVLKQNRELEMSHWETKCWSKRRYPRNLWKYYFLEDDICTVANKKKHPLPIQETVWMATVKYLVHTNI